ncbi:DUF2059 domain-containing protein [Flavobacterium sp.]|uniref:DUF2059 domain-containing protein n=1 Tax=Flavobacterium sp. TaxID=239 RepID=UPI003BE4205F
MKKLILTFGIVLVSQFGFSQESKTKPAATPVITTSAPAALPDAPIDEALKKDVLKVIERSGTGGQISGAKKQILAMIPQEKQEAFLVEFDAMVSKIYDASAKIYMEEYTKEDIKAMSAFYESPVGKKMAEKAEVIASKSQEAMGSVQSDVQALVAKYMQ